MKKIIVIAVVVACMASVAAPQGASAEEASSRSLLERLLSSFVPADDIFRSPPDVQPPQASLTEERQRMPPEQQ